MAESKPLLAGVKLSSPRVFFRAYIRAASKLQDAEVMYALNECAAADRPASIDMICEREKVRARRWRTRLLRIERRLLSALEHQELLIEGWVQIGEEAVTKHLANLVRIADLEKQLEERVAVPELYMSDGENDVYHCAKCGAALAQRYRYCPDCGAALAWSGGWRSERWTTR